jgi:hypothetical protein
MRLKDRSLISKDDQRLTGPPTAAGAHWRRVSWSSILVVDLEEGVPHPRMPLRPLVIITLQGVS